MSNNRQQCLASAHRKQQQQQQQPHHHHHQQQLCSSCARSSLNSGNQKNVNSCGTLASSITVQLRPSAAGRAFATVKRCLRMIFYLATSLCLSYVAWFLYDQFFDCLWASAQGLVYTSLALLASSGALLAVCKDGEFSVESRLLY
ncbi:hypothetical protein TKK_0011114 [Trichogramma kaykai]